MTDPTQVRQHPPPVRNVVGSMAEPERIAHRSGIAIEPSPPVPRAAG
jgi:hypothetical protein